MGDFRFAEIYGGQSCCRARVESSALRLTTLCKEKLVVNVLLKRVKASRLVLGLVALPSGLRYGVNAVPPRTSLRFF